LYVSSAVKIKSNWESRDSRENIPELISQNPMGTFVFEKAFHFVVFQK